MSLEQRSRERESAEGGAAGRGERVRTAEATAARQIPAVRSHLFTLCTFVHIRNRDSRRDEIFFSFRFGEQGRTLYHP